MCDKIFAMERRRLADTFQIKLVIIKNWWCPEKCAVKLNNAKMNIKES